MWATTICSYTLEFFYFFRFFEWFSEISSIRTRMYSKTALLLNNRIYVYSNAFFGLFELESFPENAIS